MYKTQSSTVYSGCKHKPWEHDYCAECLIAELEQEVRLGDETIADANTHISQLQAEIKRLTAALNMFGEHDTLCPHMEEWGSCTCGYDDALEGE